MSVFALHGFLGLPSDWKWFYCPDLYKTEVCLLNLIECARYLNDQAEKIFSSDRILLGYSMGGRLALHMLLERPELWSKAIFVSTHPGLKSGEERKSRLEGDVKWASRFLEDDWDCVMNDWNAQDVFKGEKIVFERFEKDYDRKNLSSALVNWSLGHQEDLSERIAQVNVPIEWVVGEKDIRFLQLGQSQRFAHPASRLVIIPNAGHRTAMHSKKINV